MLSTTTSNVRAVINVPPTSRTGAGVEAAQAHPGARQHSSLKTIRRHNSLKNLKQIRVHCKNCELSIRYWKVVFLPRIYYPLRLSYRNKLARKMIYLNLQDV